MQCPKCNAEFQMPSKYIYDIGCPRCGSGLRIRNGKAYEKSDIAGSMHYFLTVIFANLVRADEENKDAYFAFFEHFLELQTLTQSQYNDLIKVFRSEQKGFFKSNYKKIILEFKNSINELFKSTDRMIQQQAEDNMLSWVYQMAKSTQEIKIGQIEILNCFVETFRISEERKQAVIQQFKSNEPKKITNDIDGAFSMIASQVAMNFPMQEDFITKLIVSLKRGFVTGLKRNYRNLITILSNEETIVEEILNQVSQKMNDEVLIFGQNVYIDCAEYNDDSSFMDFQATLINQLNLKNEIITFKNFKALSKKGIEFVSELFVNGKIRFNNGMNEISAGDTFFVILTASKKEEFLEIVGEKVYNVVGDVLELNELTKEEIVLYTTNMINNAVKKLRENLNIDLFYDPVIIEFIANVYNKNIGMKSVEIFIENNISKALVEFKLKQQVEQEKIIVVLSDNKLALAYKDNIIPIEKLLPKMFSNSLEEIKIKLEKIIGLGTVKEYVLKLEDNVLAQKMREQIGLRSSSISMNMIFTGNPGTGKTTIARIVAEYLKALGVISTGQLIEVSRNDLVGEYQGQTAQKTAEKIKAAIGGVLFIDEAYALCRNDSDSFGLEAIDTLVKMMEDNKNDLVVILAGYSNEMNEFLKNNSGLKSRFPNIIDFPDYTPQEMYKIAEGIAKSNDYSIASDAIEPLMNYFAVKNIKGRNDSGNGRLARNTIEKAIVNHSKRILRDNNGDYETLKLEDFELESEKELDLTEIKSKLNKIIGLQTVKDYILKLEDNVMAQRRRGKAGFKSSSISMNMIFTGNPGTGKTTIARIVAEYLKELGVLSEGQFVEVSRNDLIGEYQGHTAQKTADKIFSALGGVLFIDEAYSLCRNDGDTFGLEAVDTLVKMMEDYKDNLVVILAGYSEEMKEFLQNNSGLKSRFPNVIDFPDYTPQEMYAIAEEVAKSKDYIIDEECFTGLTNFFATKNIKGRNDSGNGRLARNIVEKAIINQSNRILSENSEDYQTLKLVDFELQTEKEVDLTDIKEKLSRIIGLQPVKNYVLKLEDNIKAQKMRQQAGFKNSSISMNMIFTGNPGTGKTTIARIVAEYLNRLGVLSEGQFVEVSRNDLIGEYQGHTAQKTADKIFSALGGVLFIDEAYSLCRNDGDTFGLEAIDTLVKMMEDYKDNLVVILAGYSEEMKEFLKNNSGLKSRFPNIIDFPDYTPQELYGIAEEIAKNRDYIIDIECVEPLTNYFGIKNVKGKNDSGNGRLARNMVERAIINKSNRILQGEAEDYQTLKLVDFEIKEKEEFDLESQFENIIGLDEVKNYIRALAARIRVNKEREKLGLITNNVQTLHMIFAGNPGTGKTMMARTVADLLYNLNVISTNNLVETDRAGLVAGYVGQTAQKTTDKVFEAMNGVLFIDEAYTLAQGGENDFGQEAIDTLVKLMDDNRDRLVVILAGYSREMQYFLATNSGLQSRFPNIVEFKDYNLEQLMLIATNLFERNGYELSEQAVQKLTQVLDEARLNPDFGNGRYVRNIFERATNNQALRVSYSTDLSRELLVTIMPDDIEKI